MKKEQNKEYEKKMKKAGIAALSVSVLTAGTVGIVSAYQNSRNYKPSKNERDIQDNQVVFSDDDTIGRKKKQNKEESELLKKNKDGKDSNKNQDNPDFLFDGSNMLLNGNASMTTVADGSGITAGQSGTSNGNVYNLTGDAANADLLLNGGTNGTGNGGSNQTGSGNGTAGAGNTANAGKDNTADNNGQGNNNGNQDSDPSEPDDHPVKPRPSATVKDPDAVKNNPSGDFYRPFAEGVTPNADTDADGNNTSVIIMQNLDMDTAMLYKGQTVDAETVYNALSTFVIGSDGKGYLWGSEAYGKYIRIIGISFDGGSTWEEQFPVTIPEKIEEGQMKIRVEYRTSLKAEKWGVREVYYEPRDTRLFVLSREVEENETQIDPSTILNTDNQYPDLESTVNLLMTSQTRYLGMERLTQLFPGWMEDGKLVPWFYKVTSGRHILEPAEMVPLDSSYVVKLQYVWMSDDYKVDGEKYQNLCYLQTLTDVESPWNVGLDDKWQSVWSYNKLTVPKYIQAVRIDEKAALSVNYIEIPDTVLYIELEKSGMRINQGYTVDSDNPNYSATEEGLLMNKDATEILSIPYNKTAITIPDTVKSVNIEKKNQLQKIIVEKAADGELPAIGYDRLKDCKVIVPDEEVENVLKDNQDYFTKKTGNTVAAESDTDTEYYIEDGMIVDTSGNLKKVLQTGSRRIKLPEDIKMVQKDAFSEAGNVTSVIMPKKGATVQFEKESLENSNVTTILCYGKKQYDSVVEQLKAYGLTGISAEMLEQSKEGYAYSLEYKDGEERYTLIDAPITTEKFEGKVTAQDGTPVEITEIGENAFSGCEYLSWVFLPESVDTIGSQAFQNCTKLQGIMIRNKEKITIGNGALDGCDSLRFVGSNAMYGEFQDGYDPMVTDSWNMLYFYVPTGAKGYSSNCPRFTEESGVASYDVISDGSNGWILYGEDEKGTPWIALRSGDTVADHVKLPDTTIEIYSYAFAETTAESGGVYTVNLEDTETWALDEGAFRNSDIGTDLVLNTDSWVFDYAFSGCGNLQSVEFPGTGELTLGTQVLAQCKNLKSVRIGETDSGIYSGFLDGCDSVTDLYFENENAAKLTTYGSFAYQFNYDWTGEEESEKLHIHIPEGSEEKYIKAWRFMFAGYVDSGDRPAYLQMWSDVQWENINWETWENPADSVVDEKLKEKLLMYENRIRKMIGASSVSEPVDFYPYHVDGRGYVRLAGVPSYVTSVDLGDTDFMGLPAGWYFDGIEPYAFAGTKELKEIDLPYDLSELSNNAFAGIESGSLTIRFNQWWAIDFVLEDGKPFSFGVDDSVLHIEVWDFMQDECIQTWSYKLAGYDDLESMRAAVKEELTVNGKEPSDVEVDTEIARRLLPQVNRLRRMMGMEEIEKLDAEAFGLNVEETESAENNAEESQETETTEAQKAEKVQKSEEAESNQQEDTDQTGQDQTDTGTKDPAQNDTDRNQDASAAENDDSGTAQEEQPKTESGQSKEKASTHEGKEIHE